jgi:hypothetical protein
VQGAHRLEYLDLNRLQGDIGLFVPDAGYPFGGIPDWLVRQRSKVPDRHEESWPPARARNGGPKTGDERK